MQSFHVSFQYSAWWLIVIFLVSASLAWLMYSGKNSWDKRMKTILASLRFLAIFLLLLLFLNPQLTFVSSFKEKPLLPIVVDNSQSVTLATKNEKELKETVAAIQKKLQNAGFESAIFTHNATWKESDSLLFNHPSSDIAKLLQRTEKATHERKVENILLLSDGIFNSGISPVYQPYHSQIITLGLGDTVPRKDLALKSLQNNSVAFLGNKFPLRAEIQAVGFQNKEIGILLKGSKGIIARESAQVKSEFWTGKIDFLVPATEKGFQRFTVEIVPIRGETNLLNNRLNTYVDVVDDHENVLIVSSSPHPNIKAVRSALAKLENIQVEVFIPEQTEPKQVAYDMVIFHNCLEATVPEAKKYIKESTPVLYVMGSQSDFGRFNTENGLVEVVSHNQVDQVQAASNDAFSRFKLNDEINLAFGKLPPVEVPFGEIKIRMGTEVALYQKISDVQSQKPLLLFGQGKRKTGVLLTDGLWLWRMYEAQETGKAEMVDELIAKTVQYLSSKEDKRKFRLYPHQREYNEGEAPRLETELYNDLYEKVYGQKTSLRLSGQGLKTKMMEFTPAEGNTSLALPSLSPGVYKVEGKTVYAGKELTAYTEFIVKERQLEALDLRANHQLLRELTNKSKGYFYPWGKKEEFLKSLDKLEAKPIWKSEEKTRELIDEKWYFFLILVILIAEWGIRRYTGGY